MLCDSGSYLYLLFSKWSTCLGTESMSWSTLWAVVHMSISFSKPGLVCPTVCHLRPFWNLDGVSDQSDQFSDLLNLCCIVNYLLYSEVAESSAQDFIHTFRKITFSSSLFYIILPPCSSWERRGTASVLQKEGWLSGPQPSSCLQYLIGGGVQGKAFRICLPIESRYGQKVCFLLEILIQWLKIDEYSWAFSSVPIGVSG